MPPLKSGGIFVFRVFKQNAVLLNKLQKTQKPDEHIGIGLIFFLL